MRQGASSSAAPDFLSAIQCSCTHRRAAPILHRISKLRRELWLPPLPPAAGVTSDGAAASQGGGARRPGRLLCAGARSSSRLLFSRSLLHAAPARVAVCPSDLPLSLDSLPARWRSSSTRSCVDCRLGLSNISERTRGVGEAPRALHVLRLAGRGAACQSDVWSGGQLPLRAARVLTAPMQLAALQPPTVWHQCSPYGDLETKRPDEDRQMNASNGSLIAVRCGGGASRAVQHHGWAWCGGGMGWQRDACMPACLPRAAPADLLPSASALLASQLRGACSRGDAQHAGQRGARRLP